MALEPTDYLIGLSHVGLVTADLDAQVARLKTVFSLDDSEVQYDQNQNVRFAYLSIGGTPYEVIQPVSEQSRARLLTTNLGVNHVCYAVNDIEKAVAAMEAKCVRLGHVTPDGIIDAPDRRMAYFDPEDMHGVLVEFLEFL